MIKSTNKVYRLKIRERKLHRMCITVESTAVKILAPVEILNGYGNSEKLYQGGSVFWEHPVHMYSVRQKKVSPKVFCHFLSNRSEFLHEISHIYYSFIVT